MVQLIGSHAILPFSFKKTVRGDGVWPLVSYAPQNLL